MTKAYDFNYSDQDYLTPPLPPFGHRFHPQFPFLSI
jgi:hypothetical protein